MGSATLGGTGAAIYCAINFAKDERVESSKDLGGNKGEETDYQKTKAKRPEDQEPAQESQKGKEQDHQETSLLGITESGFETSYTAPRQ